MQSLSSPAYSRRPGQPSPGRPALGRANSFQRQLVTSGPTPPSLIHSHYLEDPQSIFNGGGGGRHTRTNQLPNEHDKLCLMDTVPMSSRSTSSSSAGSAVSETGQLVPAAARRAGASGTMATAAGAQWSGGDTAVAGGIGSGAVRNNEIPSPGSNRAPR
jgi:hypothetical protein